MRYFFFILFITFSVLSCSKKNALQDLELPQDSAINDANRFALVTETYVSLRDKPGDDGISIAHARRSEIFPVEGIEIIKTGDTQVLWVNLGIGWIKRDSIQLYSSKDKVKKAAESM